MSSEKVLSVARKAELKPKQYTTHNSWKDNLKQIATKVNLDVEGLHHNSSKETTFDLLVKTIKNELGYLITVLRVLLTGAMKTLGAHVFQVLLCTYKYT